MTGPNLPGLLFTELVEHKRAESILREPRDILKGQCGVGARLGFGPAADLVTKEIAR